MARRGRAAAARAEEPDDEPARATARPQPKDKMSVLMSNPVRRRLRVAAAVQDRDVSEVIEDAVQQYLDSWDRERATRGLPPLTVE